MKIAINNRIVETEDISSITEVKERNIPVISPNNYRTYNETNFTICFYEGRGTDMTFTANNYPHSVFKLKQFQESIVNIWSAHSHIPKFKF